MRVTSALRLKVNVLIVLHPSERERAGTIYPGIVVLGDDDAGLSGRRIEGENPTVLVVGGPGHKHSAAPVFGPEWLRELGVPLAWLVRASIALPAPRAGL